MQNIYEVEQSNKIKSGLITALFSYSLLLLFILYLRLLVTIMAIKQGLGYVGIALIFSGISAL